MANFTPQQIEQFLQEFFDVVGARQYVGARYVPIFGRVGDDSVEWDNSAPYEPLSIVIYRGNSYTSRQYVPKDVPITDTDYWVQTGNWNAQIEQYRQQVLTFQSQIDDKIPFPIPPESKYGTQGQVLGTLTDGTVRWVDPVIVTSEIAGPLIEEWLDEHPEATTTVQDGAVTTAKLADGAVTDEKLSASGVLSTTSHIIESIANQAAMDDKLAGDYNIYPINLNVGYYHADASPYIYALTRIPCTPGDVITVSNITGAGNYNYFFLRFFNSDGEVIANNYVQNNVNVIERTAPQDTVSFDYAMTKDESVEVRYPFVVIEKNKARYTGYSSYCYEQKYIDVLTTENLFNKNNVIKHYVLWNGEVGTTYFEPFFITDYIPVTPGQKYIMTRIAPYGGCWYNFDKTFNSNIYPEVATENYVMTVPDGVYWARFNGIDGSYGGVASSIDTTMVVKGETLPSNYVGFGLARRMTGKNVVCFGDSITWYDGQTFASSHAESGRLAVGYETYIRDITGATVVNAGQSGYTMPSLLPSILAYDYTNVDIVTLTAGSNDFRRTPQDEPIGQLEPIGSTFDTTTFYGSFQAAIEHILTANNKCQIMLMTPIKGWSSNTPDAASMMPAAYPDAIIAIADLYSLPLCDWYYHSGINTINCTAYIGDSNTGYKLHPTNLGFRRMGNMVAAKILEM